MKRITLTHSSDFKVTTLWEGVLHALLQPSQIYVDLYSLAFLSPIFLFRSGEFIQAGDIFAYDQIYPFIRYAAPASGILKIADDRLVISVSKEDFLQKKHQWTNQDLQGCDVTKLTDALVSSGLWPLFRQRPSNRIPDPTHLPQAIYISLDDSEPYCPRASFLFQEREHQGYFETAIHALRRLSSQVYVASPADDISLKLKFRSFITHDIEGQFPSGHPGIFFCHARDFSEENVWLLNGYDALRIGQFLKTGFYPFKRIISVSGLPGRRPLYAHAFEGMRISDVVQGLQKHHTESACTDDYAILGGILSGRSARGRDVLGVHDRAIHLLNELPFSKGNQQKYAECVRCDYCSDACPVSLFPQRLYDAHLNKKPLKGLSDCVGCGLCTYVCPTELPLGDIFRRAKRQYVT